MPGSIQVDNNWTKAPDLIVTGSPTQVTDPPIIDFALLALCMMQGAIDVDNNWTKAPDLTVTGNPTQISDPPLLEDYYPIYASDVSILTEFVFPMFRPS